MRAATLLSHARRSAGLTQRELAAHSGIAQPAIARIESGGSVPRFDTMQRLLEGCNTRIELEPSLGEGVDRSTIRRLLHLSHAERLDLAVREANNLAAIGL